MSISCSTHACSHVLQVLAVVVIELSIKYTCAVQVRMDRQNMLASHYTCMDW